MDDLKLLGNKFNYNINDIYLKRLNDRIYNWYADRDHLLLRFMWVRGSFREDIFKLCILYKKIIVKIM